jgi:hypothetical protein
MNSTHSVKRRRQVYELSARDLLDIPAWQFATNEEGIPGQDEATVRPYLRMPVNSADGLLVVRATFTLASGTNFIGYISPPPPGKKGCVHKFHPNIVTDRGQVPFYFGIFPPSKERIAELLHALGKSAGEVFPLSFKTDSPIQGGAIEGQVAGFSFLQGDEEQIVLM